MIIFVILAVCIPSYAQTPDELIAIRNNFDKALNAHDLDTALSYWADDCVYDYVALPTPFEGKEAIRGFFEDLFVGFPDFGTTEGHILAADNIVVVEHSTTGTHLGEWMGIPPTGISSPAPHIDIYEFEGDKIKHVSTYLDAASIMIQLGVQPVPQMPELVPSFTPPDPEPTGLATLEACIEAFVRWDSHDLNHYTKIVHKDAQFFVSPLGVPMDRNAWLAASELYYQGFPDIHGQTIRQIDMGDGWILTESIYSGTHQGPFFGIPPSGVEASVRAGMLTCIDSDGLLIAFSDYYDNLGLIQQISPKCPDRPLIPDYLVQDEITSPSLEGNLLGDPAKRPVLVYLPPSYETSPNKRYPTIYLLHGFCADHTCFISTGATNVGIEALTGINLGIDVGDVMAELIAADIVDETIIVMPNALNSLGGSIYESSPLIGDYRNYVVKDLVDYIDGKYRTIVDKNHRAITGHSMGGYGAISLAIEYPDVFGAVAALSPAWSEIEAEPTVVDEFTTLFPLVLGLPIVGSTDDDLWNLFLSGMQRNVLYALAAAWTPNLENPPFYVDLPVLYPGPTKVEDIWDIWKEYDLVSQIERNGSNLSGTPIYVNEGRGSTILMTEMVGIDHLLEVLYMQGLSYTYEAFDGDHLTHLRYQLAAALKFLCPYIASTNTP
jgi:steroid delta-isomerase-like uncharacterized protein